MSAPKAKRAPASAPGASAVWSRDLGYTTGRVRSEWRRELERYDTIIQRSEKVRLDPSAGEMDVHGDLRTFGYRRPRHRVHLAARVDLEPGVAV